MSDLATRQAIQTALGRFASQPLAEAARGLFGALGYQSDKRLLLSTPTPTGLRAAFDPEGKLGEQQALLAAWQRVDFLFQLADDDISAANGLQLLPFDSRNRYNGAIIQSFVFLALELRPGHYTRTALAGVTREINKLFAMPAVLLFRHGETLSLAIIQRRLHKRDDSRDVLEKVTLIRDLRPSAPHRAHLEILGDLSLRALQSRRPVASFAALQAAWQEVLDTSALNKRFYQELANWYHWALEQVRFPPDAPKEQGRDAISVIRLITRLIFCWFLREKGLVPSELFAEDRVRGLLKSLADDDNSYYTAILQNLFFATLNTEMDEPGRPLRRFINEGGTAYSDDHMVHHFWRHEQRLVDREAFEDLLRRVPFLNGGLFECLDERLDRPRTSKTDEVRVDGFSVKAGKQPQVPNFLFFGPERVVDLSRAYGELRYAQTRVRPLIPLLERYKFTVAENTPIEEEVALDPELLGHVFENLLASWNPETDTTARKATGSFYTPRVVVDFMVDEALLVYLQGRLSAACPESGQPFEPRLRQLLAYTDAPHLFDPAEVAALIEAIDRVKILDPACGSGAFPLGALHKLVFILSRLDPGNQAWKERQRAKAEALDVARQEAIQAVEAAFARDQGDYCRKLYLIENCLYGVDIQPIATQIAKLRCFISLVVEQEPDDRLPNRGILPLPNLETKFIAANTLIGLSPERQGDLAAQQCRPHQQKLRRLRHEHFLARSYREKTRLRHADRETRAELARTLQASGGLAGPEAELLAGWDPYHADRAAPFFDPESMFSLNEGFDLVIGNPPYVRQEELKNQRVFAGIPGLEQPLKQALKQAYFCYTGVADLFVYFYEKAFDLLAVGGVLSFITSNKYFRAGYGERLRHFLTVNGEIRLLIDFGDAPVFTAIAYPSIVVVKKVRETREKQGLSGVPKELAAWSSLVRPDLAVRALLWEPQSALQEFPSLLAAGSSSLPQHRLSPEGWRVESSRKHRIMEHLQSAGRSLAQIAEDRVYRGITTGLNEVFVVDRATRDSLVAADPAAEELLKPFARGRDVDRWQLKPGGSWLIFTRRGCDIRRFPAVHDYLKQFEAQLAPGGSGGRKPGRYEWFEIQDNIAYWRLFDRPKIVSTKVSKHSTFALDEDGYYLGNTTYFLPAGSDPRFTLGVLNSTLFEAYARRVFVDKQNGWYEVQPEGLASFRIPEGDGELRGALMANVHMTIEAKALDSTTPLLDIEAQIDGLVAHLYGLSEDDYRFILAELDLPEPFRVAALNAYRDEKRRR